MWSTVKSATAPLRLAFFGSDAFSVTSLARLHALKLEKPGLIAQLDVITRSIKPTGRNLKNYIDVPVGAYAAAHRIPVWRADSVSDILSLRNCYDLAVAVSYGKLIPGEFLSATTYGGINVHPSLLPKYSGSSPIQYALMEDATHTGVTVQTLHPTKFDHGSIIVQSERIDIADSDNFALLLSRLANVGAALLEEVIVSGKYIEPIPVESGYSYSLASKITPKRSEVNWNNFSSRQIRRLHDALGPLHTYKMVDIVKKKKHVHELYKVILDEIKEIDTPAGLTNAGQFILANSKLVVKTTDGAVSIGKLKFQYCVDEDPATFFKHLPKRAGNTPHVFERQQH